MQPRLGISPTRSRNRPASAKTRSNFAPKSDPLAASGGALGQRITSTKSAGSAGATRTATITTPTAAGAAATATSKSNPTSPVAHLEDALVTNLKQQVSCLELELKFLKNENETLKAQLAAKEASAAAAPAAVVSPAAAAAANMSIVNQSINGAVDSSVVANMEMMKKSIGGASLDFRANHGDLYAHAQRLEQEVADLREKFAIREQEHALEMAGYKGTLEVGGLSRAHSAASGFKIEIENRAEQHKREVEQLKEQNAQEVVALKKTIERIQMEGTTHAMELEATKHAKDAATKEVIALKDALRNLTSEADIAKRQQEEAMTHLKTEQEKRRQLETREQDVRKSFEELQQDTVKNQSARIAQLEQQVRDSSANLHMKTFENEQMKVTTEKLNAELLGAANQKADLSSLLDHNNSKLRETEERCKRLEASLGDAASERDFYKLSTDRLKVEHSVLEVKLSQLEAKVNSDRAGILTLEKQYCSALDQNEALKRESKNKETLYQSLDSHDDNVRKENKMLTDENQRLAHNNKRLESDLADMQAKYEAVRGFAEQAKAESQIMNALNKLDKTKNEMASMVQTQMKLAHEVSHVVYEMPDTTSVTRAMSPQHADPSNTSIQATPIHASAPSSVPAVTAVPPPSVPEATTLQQQLSMASSGLVAPQTTEIITPMAAETPSAGDAVNVKEQTTPVVVNPAARDVTFEQTTNQYIPQRNLTGSTHSASEWNE